jgi:hypothetical protein
MSIIKLWRGDECAIVEAGSEADATMRGLGFGDDAESELADWPLKATSPAEYIEQHGEDEDPSEIVAARLELARKLVDAE